MTTPAPTGADAEPPSLRPWPARVGTCLSIADLGAEGIEEVLRVSDAFVEVAAAAHSQGARPCGDGRW